MEDRIAQIDIDINTLQRLLKLPEDTKILNISMSSCRRRSKLVIQHPELDRVSQWSFPPYKNYIIKKDNKYGEFE